jgi:hypothetical protein
MRFPAILIALLTAGVSQGVSVPRNNDGGSYLDQVGLSTNNKELFEYGMTIMDDNFGLPFL